jgi:transcriptional regulator with XRE-family HTH domain
MPMISTRLRAARERRGWSRETLAHYTGLSWAGIAQIEAGRRTNVRPDTLLSLAAALDVTVDYLLGAAPGRSLLVHGALFYGSAEEFLETTLPILHGAVERSEGALVVSTLSNRELLKRALGRLAKRIRYEDSRHLYESPLAATEAYGRFLRDQLRAGSSWVNVIGEPVWDGLGGDETPWLTYEAMFNLVFAGAPMTTICPYNLQQVDPSIVESARLTHPSVFTGAGAADNPAFRGVTDYLFTDRSAPVGSGKQADTRSPRGSGGKSRSS